MGLSFRRANGGVVAIGDAAQSVLDEHRQLGDLQREAGGILLGRWILDSKDVVIDEALPPASRDRRGRFFIWRAREPAQRRVNEAWAESRRTRCYLGEWHTHPEDDPSPSDNDWREWHRILCEAVYEQDGLFFLIVGRRSMRIREGARRARSIAPLAPVMLR